MLNSQYQRIPGGDEGGEGLELGSPQGAVPQSYASSAEVQAQKSEEQLTSLFPHRQRASSGSLGSTSDRDREEHGTLLSTSYDRTLLSRSTPVRAAPPVVNTKWATTSLWCGYFILVVLLTGGLLSVFKFTMELQSQVVLLSTSVRSLERDLAVLRSESRQDIGTVSDDIMRIETNYTRKIDTLDGRLDDVDATLVKLTNRTTNADVLEQMRETREWRWMNVYLTKLHVPLPLPTPRSHPSLHHPPPPLSVHAFPS